MLMTMTLSITLVFKPKHRLLADFLAFCPWAGTLKTTHTPCPAAHLCPTINHHQQQPQPQPQPSHWINEVFVVLFNKLFKFAFVCEHFFFCCVVKYAQLKCVYVCLCLCNMCLVFFFNFYGILLLVSVAVASDVASFLYVGWGHFFWRQRLIVRGT